MELHNILPPKSFSTRATENQWIGQPVGFSYMKCSDIDPFSDKDPMSVYHNILKGKLRFPKGFDEDAKSFSSPSTSGRFE